MRTAKERTSVIAFKATSTTHIFSICFMSFTTKYIVCQTYLLFIFLCRNTVQIRALIALYIPNRKEVVNLS